MGIKNKESIMVRQRRHESLPAVVEEPERTELRGMIETLPIELIREMLELGRKGRKK